MIEQLSLNEARRYLSDHGMKIGNVALANGLEQGVFPFGVCVNNDGNRDFFIYKALVDKFIKEISGE